MRQTETQSIRSALRALRTRLEGNIKGANRPQYLEALGAVNRIESLLTAAVAAEYEASRREAA